MRKRIQNCIEKILPVDRFLILIFAFTFNSIVYSGSRIIAGDWHHYILTSRLDEEIPLIPESLLIYFGCYIFWAVNYILIAKQDEEKAYQFFLADMISRIICFLIFILFPTTNIRPDIVGEGMWNEGMRFLYQIDAADNLLPSIHCLVSWFCYIGIRGEKKISKWYQWASCTIAILVFVSTLTTKQHVMIDVIAGVIIAEGTLWFTRHTRLYIKYMCFWKGMSDKIFKMGGKRE
ncbi:phosphatase PAP2 family protein [Faecalimonas sp.]